MAKSKPEEESKIWKLIMRSQGDELKNITKEFKDFLKKNENLTIDQMKGFLEKKKESTSNVRIQDMLESRLNILIEEQSKENQKVGGLKQSMTKSLKGIEKFAEESNNEELIKEVAKLRKIRGKGWTEQSLSNEKTKQILSNLQNNFADDLPNSISKSLDRNQDKLSELLIGGELLDDIREPFEQLHDDMNLLNQSITQGNTLFKDGFEKIGGAFSETLAPFKALWSTGVGAIKGIYSVYSGAANAIKGISVAFKLFTSSGNKKRDDMLSNMSESQKEMVELEEARVNREQRQTGGGDDDKKGGWLSSLLGLNEGLGMIGVAVAAFGLAIGAFVGSIIISFKVFKKLFIDPIIWFGKILGGLGWVSSLINFVERTRWLGGIIRRISSGISAVGGVFTSIGVWFTRIIAWADDVKRGTVVVGRFGRYVALFVRSFAIGLKFLGLPLTIVLGLIDFVKGFMSTEGSIIDKIKGGLFGVVDGLIGLPVKLLGWITDWILGLFGIEIEGGSASKIMGAIKATMGYIVDWFMMPITAIIDFVKGFSSTEGSIIDKYQGGMHKAITGIISIPLKIIGWMIDGIAGLFGIEMDSAKTIMEWISAGLTKLFNIIYWPFKKLWGLISWLWGGVKSVASGFVSAVGWIFGKIWELFSIVIDYILAPFKTIWEGLKFLWNIVTGDWGGAMENLQNIGNIFGDLIDKIFNFFLDLIPSWDSIKGAFRGMIPDWVPNWLLPDWLKGGSGDGESKADKKKKKKDHKKEIEELDDSGAIDKNWIGKSKVKDWKVIEESSLNKINALIALDDWDKETGEKLKRLRDKKIKESKAAKAEAKAAKAEAKAVKETEKENKTATDVKTTKDSLSVAEKNLKEFEAKNETTASYRDYQIEKDWGSLREGEVAPSMYDDKEKDAEHKALVVVQSTAKKVAKEAVEVYAKDKGLVGSDKDIEKKASDQLKASEEATTKRKAEAAKVAAEAAKVAAEAEAENQLKKIHVQRNIYNVPYGKYSGDVLTTDEGQYATKEYKESSRIRLAGELQEKTNKLENYDQTALFPTAGGKKELANEIRKILIEQQQVENIEGLESGDLYSKISEIKKHNKKIKDRNIALKTEQNSILGMDKRELKGVSGAKTIFGKIKGGIGKKLEGTRLAEGFTKIKENFSAKMEGGISKPSLLDGDEKEIDDSTPSFFSNLFGIKRTELKMGDKTPKQLKTSDKQINEAMSKTETLKMEREKETIKEITKVTKQAAPLTTHPSAQSAAQSTQQGGPVPVSVSHQPPDEIESMSLLMFNKSWGMI